MDLKTLRDDVRDLLDETSGNLSDPVLNTLIERATQRIEADFADDYGETPRQMITAINGTIAATGFALPSDWLRARSVKIGDAILRYVAPELMPNESSGEDSTVYLVYYARIPKLVNDTDTNWLLDIASRVYVYATAVEYTLWNKEAAQDRANYQQEYMMASDTTARSNSARSSGGFQRFKAQMQGTYSVVGDNMIFGYQF